MKKGSTVAAKQGRNFKQQKLTIGLDLGDRASWYCVLEQTGAVLWEQRVSTTPKAMREAFSTVTRSRIALETGTHSPWVSRLLAEFGHEVIVAHARNVRLIGESRRGDGCCLLIHLFSIPISHPRFSTVYRLRNQSEISSDPSPLPA